jgi:acyl carrier protein
LKRLYYCLKRGSYYGCAQIENVKSPDKPPANHQYEADLSHPDRVQHLRQPGCASPGLPQMRVLPGKTGDCPECKGVTRVSRSWKACFERNKKWTTFGGKETMDELFEKMKKLIADKLEIDESKVTLDASFRQDLGADSLDTYELVYAIEEEMGISIPDEKANEFEKVQDAYDFIKSQK